jgi:hypothetical protein
VLSTLRYFRQEYEAHIEQHTCPSHKCQMVTDSDPKGEVY